MTDEEILQRLGLSSDDATDMVRKQQGFLDSLNAAQTEAIQRTLPDWEDAAAAMGDDCSVDDLNDFVSKRGHKPSNGALSVPMPADDEC